MTWAQKQLNIELTKMYKHLAEEILKVKKDRKQ